MADDTSTNTSTSTTDAGAAGAEASATDAAATTDATVLGEAGKAALEKERATARDATKAKKDAERALSAATAELEKLRQASMSDQEKAVAKAREEGASEARLAAMKEVGGRLVVTELRAALTGRLAEGQRAALLATVDRAQFLTDDGDVDVKAVGRWADAVAPPTEPDNRFPDLGQGRRAGAPAPVDMNDRIRRLARRGQ